jgi:hypothetical protein
LDHTSSVWLDVVGFSTAYFEVVGYDGISLSASKTQAGLKIHDYLSLIRIIL